MGLGASCFDMARLPSLDHAVDSQKAGGSDQKQGYTVFPTRLGTLCVIVKPMISNARKNKVNALAGVPANRKLGN